MADDAYASSNSFLRHQMGAASLAWGRAKSYRPTGLLATATLAAIAAGRFLPLALLAVALLLPLLFVVHDGLSLTSFQEESTGYRYFYTLRMLYGDGERPWLPQGQAVGLIHMVIQVVLTALGYPPSQLFPRIDIFAYVASAFPLLAVCAAYYWTQQWLRSWVSKLTLSLAIIVTYFDIRSWGFDVLTKPDYPASVGAVGLVTLALLLRLREPHVARWSSERWTLWLGLFAGVCLAIKVTYVIFPATVALAITARGLAETRPEWWRRALKSTTYVALLTVAGISVAIATFVALLLIYYLGSVSAVVTHFSQLSTFVAAVGNSKPFLLWLSEDALRIPPDLITLSALLPVLLVGAALASLIPAATPLLRGRWLAIVALPGAVLWTWFIYQRFVSQTLIEANMYTLVVGAAWLVTVGIRPRPIVSATIVGAVAIMGFMLIRHFASDVYPSDVWTDAQARRWERLLATVPGTTLFLIPENEWRFATIDTAIYKGGTGIRVDEGWGSSAFMLSMFPDRWYLANDRVNLGTGTRQTREYTKFAFVRDVTTNGAAAAVTRIRALGVSVDGLDCLPAVQMQSTNPRDEEMVLCVAPTASSAPLAAPPAELDPLALDLATQLGVPVEPAPGERAQFIVRAHRNAVDLERIGTITSDVGYSVGIALPSGGLIGVRFEPTPRQVAGELAGALGVAVDPAPGEPSQFLIRAHRDAVDLNRVGTIHSDVGYSIGLTLPSGDQIGVRFELNARQVADELALKLGVPVDPVPAEPGQFLIRARADAVDLERIGTVRNDTGYSIGVVLPSGQQIGVRFPSEDELLIIELSAKLGVPIDPAPGEPGQFLIRGRRDMVDLQRIGTITSDVGYSVGMKLPNGDLIGIRFEPTGRQVADELAAKIDASVDPVPGEPGQYLLRATREAVNLERLGTIHSDLGYSVGITLPSGDQIGVRFEPMKTSQTP